LNPTLHTRVGLVFERVLAKAPEERYESCSDFMSALAAACNANPEWIPLPRGASEDMPTVASDPGSTSPVKARTTMIETVADVRSDDTTQPDARVPEVKEPEPEPMPEPVAVAVAAPLPRPAAVIPPPAYEPRREAAPNHTLRNVVLAAIMVALIGAAVYSLSERSGGDVSQNPAIAPETDAVPQQPPAPGPVATPPVQTPAASVQPAAPPPAPAAGTKAAPAVTQGAFAVSSAPPGISAVFDDDPATACTTPCEVTLASGRHTFLLRKEGYRDARRIIEIPRDTAMLVELAQMIGTLSLITDPPGLTVFIDGRQQAQKTPLSVPLPAGQHRVEAVRGNDRQQISVDITDGSITARSLSWQ
jgi:hypothetical protein